MKHVKPDDSQYPWIVSDFIQNVTLSPSLAATLDLLKLYAIDPKGTRGIIQLQIMMGKLNTLEKL